MRHRRFFVFMVRSDKISKGSHVNLVKMKRNFVFVRELTDGHQK